MRLILAALLFSGLVFGQLGGSAGVGASVGGASSSPSVSIPVASPVTGAFSYRYYCDVAGGCTVNLPTITSGDIGKTLCATNYTSRSGAMVFQAPASTTIIVRGVASSSAGSVASAGALGDAACVQAVTTTVYMFVGGAGVWVGA